MLGLILLSLFNLSQGSSWPTAQLVDPPDGILIVGEGRSAVISFNVDGNPFPRDKKWYKDGNVISSSSSILIDESGGNIQTLKFNSMSRSDEGAYHTVVKFVSSIEASKSPEVIVKVSYLEEVWDNSAAQIVDARVGEFAVLECRPPAHFGADPKFKWKKGTVPITESDSMYISEYGNLVILQVAFQHSASDYRCSITIDSLKEGFQTRQGPAVSLRVVDSSASYIPPQIAMKPTDLSINAQIKETFRVECVVNGYPNLPNIKWFKDSVIISASSVIYDIQKRNYLGITIPRSGGTIEGQYRCEADDYTNIVFASANVQIYTKPIITTGLPTTQIKKSSGSELDLSCVATSTPAPSYRWYRNAIILGENINTNIDGGSLTVSNVNSMNKGVYQCEAFNEQGSTISTGMIVIQERLTFVIRPQDVEVYLSTAATFNCMGKGNPGPQSLQWQFNGGNPPSTHQFTTNIQNQATYKIPEVTSSERDGRISCIISSPDNLYPKDTATAILTLREGPQVNAHVKNLTKKEGDSVDIVCEVYNVNPNVVVWNWLFQDTLLTQPKDERITITNSLLQVRLLTEADQGTYTCQANENGLSNQDTIYVRVKTRPKITLDPSIRVGQGVDAKLVCMVSGDPKPTITWKRYNTLVQDGTAKYSIDNSVDGQSTLTVKSVDKTSDLGDYMCYGENEIGKMFKTVELIVVAACEVMELPKDQTTDHGASIIISCTVNDCATATWTWKKDGSIISFDGYRRISSRDSIELTKVVPSDGGVYSCTVNSNNNQGKEETYSATISVEVKAQITQFPANRVLYKGGDNVRMTCAAQGDDSKQPLSVEWYRSGVKCEGSKIVFVVDKDASERISYVNSVLTIETAIASDAGHYQCLAVNQYNDDRKDTTLMLMTSPDRPGQPYSTWTGVGAVELAWREPANTGNTPLTSYELHIETMGNTIFRPFVKDLDPQKVNTVIYFLNENQEYKFKVIAVNEVGKGPLSLPSNEIRTIKTITNNMNLVEKFQLTATSSDAIKVTWQMPARRNQALRGYKIVYRNEERQEQPKFLNIEDYTVLEATIEDLDAGSMYSVQVESNTLVSVDLVASTVQSAYTFNQKPTPPIGCVSHRDTASQMVVTWSRPENTHGKVTQYTIYYQPRDVGLGRGDGEWQSIVQEDYQTTTFTLSVEDTNVDYNVKVTASNAAGEGDDVGCTATGMIIQVVWYATWWFYLIVALVGALLICVIIVCICCRNRSEKGPKMHKLPPVAAKKDEFQGIPGMPGPQAYSPNTNRSYNPPPPHNNNPSNAFPAGGGMGSPYVSPGANPKFGAGDFSYGGQPPVKNPDYSYNGNKFNTYDSRATYNEPPKATYPGFEPPKSPPAAYGGGYDQSSNYDNNTYDSKYNKDRDSGSRGGYPTYDRNANNNNNTNASYGGGGGGNFKSSQL